MNLSDYPIILIFWAALPAAIAFGLSFAPERWSLNSPLSFEQRWGCGAVSLALAGSFGGTFLWYVGTLSPFRGIGRESPWPLEVLLLLPQAVSLVVVALLVRLRGRAPLRSLGFTRTNVLSLGASAAASYFLLVFLWAALRYYGQKDWSGLYRNHLIADLLVREPIFHCLIIITLVCTSACVEEIVFRGFALIPIARVVGPAAGITATAVFWSMLHFGDAPRTTAVFLLGLLLGWMFYHTGSLVPSIVFHVLWNIGATSDFVFGRLAAAGVHWSNGEHFLYIGGGSFVTGCASLLIALMTRPPRRYG